MYNNLMQISVSDTRYVKAPQFQSRLLYCMILDPSHLKEQTLPAAGALSLSLSFSLPLNPTVDGAVLSLSLSLVQNALCLY